MLFIKGQVWVADRVRSQRLQIWMLENYSCLWNVGDDTAVNVFSKEILPYHMETGLEAHAIYAQETLRHEATLK